MTATMHLLGAKASGFSPLSLTPDLWLDASDAASITSSGGAVSQWSDKSGNSRHFTQAGSGKPVTGTRTKNGLNVLDFNGSSQFLGAGDILDIGTGGMTCFVVVGFDTSNGYGVFGKNLAGTDTGRYGLYRDSGSMAFVVGGAASFGGLISTADSSSAVRCITTKLTRGGTNTTLTMRIAGSSYASSAGADGGTNFNNAIAWQIGKYGASSLWFDGVIGELIFMLRTATTQEITDTEAYLTSKWGL